MAKKLTDAYTTREMTQKLSVNRLTIYRLADLLPGHFRVNNSHRFIKEEVDKWIKQGGHKIVVSLTGGLSCGQ